MDKNIIKQYLDKTFISEAKKTEVNGTPGIKLAKKMANDNKKINKSGVGEIGKEMSKYEKGLEKKDPNEKQMAQNKINYNGDEEKAYHDQMEIMNGQEMIQYDRTPNKDFKDRALEAIEGSTRMGNNPEWANVVAKGQGGDPEFGKNLVKKIKASEKLRSKETPTSKMFGNDWEVVPDKGHKSYAFESEDKTKCPVCGKSKEDCKCTDKEKGAHAMKGLDADYEKDSRAQQHGTNPVDENKNNKSQIKETMKRLKFKKEFNGVGNALKLIPETYKVDNKVFEMTDGNESYKIRWEGSLTEGRAVVLLASDKKMVSEDMQKMKHLMGYKSHETLGLVKGKKRLDENSAFTDIWNKTKKLMSEMEDNEGDDSEHGEWDDAITSQAADAKKHIEGSTSTDKGTQAPKPKTGTWEDAAKSQAPEASKHIQGSVSSEKGTQAPKPKTGDLDDAVSVAPEAKEHLKSESVKKKITEAEDDTDELSDELDSIKNKGEEDDAPVMKRKDAYDASLDVTDPEDIEKSVSKKDIEKSMSAPTPINKDVDAGDEDEIEIPANTELKLAKSTKTGQWVILSKVGKNITDATNISDETADAIKSGNLMISKAYSQAKAETDVDMDDDELMEALNKML